MEDTVDFRDSLINLCQARLADARVLLSEQPNLLSDLSEQHLATLIDAAGEEDDWRSQMTFRATLALVRRAREIGVDPAIAEAEAAEGGAVPDELTELPSRALDAAARYEATGSVEDLDEGIACWNAVLEHPLVDRVNPGYRWVALTHGAATYFARWDHSGEARDLDTAIERWRQVSVEMTPESRGAASIHNNLAIAILSRYSATGAENDLARAIEAAETAVAEAHDDDELLPKYNADLAAALQERHLATGSMADLERAIPLYEAALDQMSSGTPVHASTLNNLATALNDRFERTGEEADRDRARELLQQSVASTAETSVHSHRHLGNLARHMSNPEEALAARRHLLEASSGNPAVRAASLNNVASSLIDAFIETFDRAALDEAIEYSEEALELVDPRSPDLALYSLNCGNARRLRFITSLDPDERLEELLRGTEVLTIAVEQGLETNPQVALKAARHAGDWYSEIENWEEAVDVYGRGLSAAAGLLRVQLGRRDQETWLKSIGDLPSRAAYANAEGGDPRAAALVMEHGHAILLAEALELKRADLDRLDADGRAELGERFRALAARWAELTHPGRL